MRNFKYKMYVSVLLVCVLCLAACSGASNAQRYTSTTYCMNTIVDQKAYGAKAEKAMKAVEEAFFSFEQELSLYKEDSDIAKINAAAGIQPVQVKAQTVALLQDAKEAAISSENAFALTLAPLSLAWGITSDSPRVLSQQEIDALLPLVDDTQIRIDVNASTVYLAKKGQQIDLGGIAKGTACNLARDIYEQYGVNSAVLSIGGNVYVRGAKPDGTLYRIGFRDPKGDASSYIASFTMQDTVFAVSGGYERYFEQDGVRYHHILDPKTGAPADSDIVSVGVMKGDGTQADFWSTTLFVWGKEKTINYMKQGNTIIMLDNQNNLYVSAALQDSFVLLEGMESKYNVIFVEKEA